MCFCVMIILLSCRRMSDGMGKRYAKQWLSYTSKASSSRSAHGSTCQIVSDFYSKNSALVLPRARTASI